MSRRTVVLCLLLAWPAASPAFTFHVPEEHGSIQAAINLASASQVDTILVGPGTYDERLLIQLKAVVLRGRDGAEATTIDGQAQGNVITVNGVGRNCIIEDLTVTGGVQTTPEVVGTAIYLNSYASPTIQRCRLVGNHARAGGGVNGYVSCEPLVKDCLIADNSGGAMVFELGDGDVGHTYADVQNTVITRNNGSGAYVLKGARVTFRNCTIAYNGGDGLSASQLARVRMYNSIVSNNQGAGIIRTDNTVCYTLGCNDVYANTLGNYLGANPGDACFPGRGSGDVSIDPCFQNAAVGNLHLQRNSPLCSLRQPDSCGVLGAFQDPCVAGGGTCLVNVQSATWSMIKSRYR